MDWLGVCHDEAILGTSDPQESLSPMNYSATLKLFLKPFHAWLGRMRGTPTGIETPAKMKFFIFVVSLL